VNFAFFSRHANHVRLELFDHPDDATASRAFDLDSACSRTGDVWHVWVEGIRPGQLYAYRVDGPYQPTDGHRFNFNKLLPDDNAGAMPKCVFHAGVLSLSGGLSAQTPLVEDDHLWNTCAWLHDPSHLPWWQMLAIFVYVMVSCLVVNDAVKVVMIKRLVPKAVA
jgi:Carbohydrate-binding module 48 (Isoamylase N-terminal domain)